jgi:hypothetical protein
MITITPVAFLGRLQQTPPKNTANSAFSSTPRSASADRFERSTPSSAVHLRSGYNEAEFINQLIERGFSPKEARHLPGYFHAFSGQAIIDRHQQVIAHLLTTPPAEVQQTALKLRFSTAECMRKLVLLDHDALELRGATPQALFEQTVKQLGNNARILNLSTPLAHYQEVMISLTPFLEVQLLPLANKETQASLQARLTALLKPTD